MNITILLCNFAAIWCSFFLSFVLSFSCKYLLKDGRDRIGQPLNCNCKKASGRVCHFQKSFAE